MIRKPWTYGKGTLRAEGISSIAVDKPTRAMLKRLAGKEPVSSYVKTLAIKELKLKGLAS